MKKKQNNISFIDKITLCYYTLIKDFYYNYSKNIEKYYHKRIAKLVFKKAFHKIKKSKADLKINKLKAKSDKLKGKLFIKYGVAKYEYDKYISYLQYKQLHKK